MPLIIGNVQSLHWGKYGAPAHGQDEKYAGIDKYPYGKMNPAGNIICDAWVFGIIPESETCAGRTMQV